MPNFSGIWTVTQQMQAVGQSIWPARPGTPTIGTATATGATTAAVAFTAGSTGYPTTVTFTATSSPGGLTGTGSSSPVTVTGLTASTSYTFTVTATNATGTSAASSASNSITTGMAPGTAYAGGFFAGQIGVSGVATHNLVVGPLSSAQSASKKWKNANTGPAVGNSNIDGPQNTADIVADGSSTVYPAAHFCNDLVIGGFSDWYMPAFNELEVCYFNLKPTTTSNAVGASGVNPNAVPIRNSGYSAGTPAQTSATDFQSGGTEAYTANYYWSSTQFQYSVSGAMIQIFSTGAQSSYGKAYSWNVRAIRRVAV
jgi:hypothetical protein